MLLLLIYLFLSHYRLKNLDKCKEKDGDGEACELEACELEAWGFGRVQAPRRLV